MDFENKITQKPSTSVVEARKILGRRYNHFSDDQVQEIIISLTHIARKSLACLGSKKH
ncbi:MAG: hypothetical protein QG623_549 [Patescibacteria group bacterium]|jgi:hypothetical protein|nr:hypothetical protein [Patescibacteria group bacterium]